MNQNLIYYVRRHKIFLSILTVVLLLGLVGNVNKFNNLPEFVDPITTTTMDPNGKHALPGKYNLVRDVLRMNGSMRRPNKKCSVGT